MSLAYSLRRPAPIRGLLLPLLVLGGMLASALSLAPTLTASTVANTKPVVCTCASCPGGANCCCLNRAR
ncbi:MAG: hypothetical protein ACO1SV_03135 [Fimbriimonas sp.]